MVLEQGGIALKSAYDMGYLSCQLYHQGKVYSKGRVYFTNPEYRRGWDTYDSIITN